MTSTALKDLLDRAENWPAEDVEELMRTAEYIELRHSSGFALNDADWKIIDARLAAARLGNVASDEEVAKVFGKYRAG